MTNTSGIVKYDPSNAPRFGDQPILSTGHVGYEAVASIPIGLIVMGFSGTPLAALPVAYWILNNLIASGKPKVATVVASEEIEERYQLGQATIQLGGNQVREVQEERTAPIAQLSPSTQNIPVQFDYQPEPIESDLWEAPVREPIAVGADFTSRDRTDAPFIGQSPSVSNLRAAMDVYESPTTAIADIAVVDSNPTPGFIDSWSDRIQNSLFVGKGGSGKGYLVSNVLRGVLRKRPDLQVLVIDPKADPREAGYWQDPEFGDRVELYARPILGSYCEDVYDWVEAGIARFNAMPAPKLLILDECTAVSGQIKSCEKGSQKLLQFWTRINSWASLGDGPGYYTWLIAQNGHMGDFGASGGVLGQFFRVAIVRGDDLAYAKTLQAGGLFNGLMPKDDRELGRLCQTSQCNRAIYDASENKWRPMPLLTNHSDYDRDRRMSLGKNDVKPLPVEPTTPSLDLDMALSFLDDNIVDDPKVITDFIDGVIAKAAISTDKHKMFGELLVEVKALGHGSILVTSAFMKEPSVAAWISKWSRSTRDRAVILTNKSQKTVASLLDRLTTDDFRLLEKVDESTYKVTLR